MAFLADSCIHIYSQYVRLWSHHLYVTSLHCCHWYITLIISVCDQFAERLSRHKLQYHLM